MAILDTARVNATNIQNQSFANLYNLLNNRSNVPNPVNSDGTTKFVYVRLPNIGRGFKGFPFIVIHRSKISKTRTTVSLTKSFMSYDFTVQVFCQDEDSDSEGNAIGSAQCDLITDNIMKTLNNATNRKSLINNGMARLEYNVETDEDEFEGRRVFTSEFDIRFEETLLLTT